MGKSILLIISFWFFGQELIAQKEANTWYFGNNAGIDFNKGYPQSITNGKLISPEGCASYSTPDGRLLFYTDGVNVWDSTHKLMPNGTGLKGDPSATQSSIIIPKPFSFTSYYIFTVDKVAGANGVRYTEVNMAFNAGKGDVVPWRKNLLILSSGCEKITAMKHADGINYWVLMHKFNSDIIYSYMVTFFGVSYFPVKSYTGIKIANYYSNTLGAMKFSPDGRKIAYANHTMDTSVIADFDALTGRVSKVWAFPIDDAYGLEFSSKGQYLYVSEMNNRKVYQYNVKSNSIGDFIASKRLIDSNYNNFAGALQMGPDNKIYISVTGSQYLHVINAPDSAADKTRPQKDAIYLGGKITQLGLPNFNQSIFNKVYIIVTRNCINDSTQFSISNTNTIDSVKWDFGEPAAMADNISNKMSDVSHVYKYTGYYTARLLYYSRRYIHFTWNKFYIKDPKPRIGNDTIFCGAFSLDLKPHKTYINYQWNNNSLLNHITVKSKGQYSIRVKDSVGCFSGDTINIINPTIKPAIDAKDSILCLKNNLLTLKDLTDYDGDSRKSVKWYFGDGTNMEDSIVKKEYPGTGTFKVKLIVSGISECTDSVEKTFKVLHHPVAKFSFNSPCFPDPVQFKNESTIEEGKITEYSWQFGDYSTSKAVNPLKSYDESGKYTVTLIVKSDKGCVDSMVKQRGITVKQKPNAFFDFKEVSIAPTYKRTILFNNLSSTDVTTYNWDFGNNKKSTLKNPTLDYLDSGMNIFTLWVTNQDNCTDSFSLSTYQKFYFYLPNVFSPDANNINETLVPVASVYIKYYTMEIYNMWGEKLFETNDIKTGWDGNYQDKPCQDGIYICKIHFTPFNGLLEHYEQPIRLMR
ncbi:MAG: PKD domain-containing protein [Bacteroidota bacterium]